MFLFKKGDKVDANWSRIQGFGWNVNGVFPGIVTNVERRRDFLLVHFVDKTGRMRGWRAANLHVISFSSQPLENI